ncbi:MAG: helix-turn-helix domain-containing protein [Pseudomonas sp.]|nr:helix-turn-helix domain-containing protein [Pseudomonas sp.]
MTVLTPFAHLAAFPEHATVVAQQHYRLHAVSCDLPLLIIPLQGHKRLRSGEQWLDCAPGEFLMLHHAQQVDIENLPTGDAPYRALTIGFNWRLLEVARSLLAMHPTAASSPPVSISQGPLTPLEPALAAYLACAADDRLAIDHAGLGLLLALARTGHNSFISASDPSLATQARLLIAADPARAWKSADLEARFAISSATLRRRLQEEQSNFRTLLQEARLHHALQLLQSRRQPLKSTAAACGYSSLASFNRAFAQRFGLEPSAVARQ